MADESHPTPERQHDRAMTVLPPERRLDQVRGSAHMID